MCKIDTCPVRWGCWRRHVRIYQEFAFLPECSEAVASGETAPTQVRIAPGPTKPMNALLWELVAGSSAQSRAVADPRMLPVQTQRLTQPTPSTVGSVLQRSFSGEEKNAPVPWEVIKASKQGERGTFTQEPHGQLSPWECGKAVRTQEGCHGGQRK